MTKGYTRGVKRANPKAHIDQHFKVGVCDPCNNLSDCRDVFSFTPATGRTIVGIKYSEGDITFPVAVDPASADFANELKTAIFNCIRQYEFNIYLTVEVDDAGLVTFWHDGQTEISALVLDDGTEIARTDRLCNKVYECTYRINGKGEIPAIEFDGASEALANNPYDYVAGDDAANVATAASLAVDVELALTTLGVDYNSVTVEVDDSAEGFVIEVKSSSFKGVCIGDKNFVNCGCEETYIDISTDDSKRVAELADNSKKLAALAKKSSKK